VLCTPFLWEAGRWSAQHTLRSHHFTIPASACRARQSRFLSLARGGLVGVSGITPDGVTANGPIGPAAAPGRCCHPFLRLQQPALSGIPLSRKEDDSSTSSKPLYGGWAPLPTRRSRKWRTGKSFAAAGGENLKIQAPNPKRIKSFCVAPPTQKLGWTPSWGRFGALVGRAATREGRESCAKN